MEILIISQNYKFKTTGNHDQHLTLGSSLAGLGWDLNTISSMWYQEWTRLRTPSCWRNDLLFDVYLETLVHLVPEISYCSDVRTEGRKESNCSCWTHRTRQQSSAECPEASRKGLLDMSISCPMSFKPNSEHGARKAVHFGLTGYRYFRQVSLCIPGWLRTHGVDRVGLEPALVLLLLLCLSHAGIAAVMY